MKKVQSAKKLRAIADRLLQTLVVKKWPKCEICGAKSYCGHHLIEKSRSNRLRYDLDNIVAVCQFCHNKIHNPFGNNSLGTFHILDVVIKKRGGKKWLDKLEKKGREIVKTDVMFYNRAIERLTDCLND